MVDFMTGRLDPAITTIADKIQRSYSAVHDALRRLRQAGFLQWIRRSRKTESKGEAGPQIEQISNAYALLVPQEMQGYLTRLLGKAPAPACEQSRRDQQQAEFRRMLDQLTAREYHDHFWSGDRLAGETMRKISEAVDRLALSQERESGRAVVTGGVLYTP